MAKLFVSDAVPFYYGSFESNFDNLNGETLKADGDLWKVAFTDGEAFVRGHDLKYDHNDTPTDISDDIVKSGDITSFSFNTTETDPSQALVRIRDIDGLSGSQVHDALESGSQEDAVGVLRTVFRGDDVLNGGSQADFLEGFKGDDKIKGNGGGDVLVGDKGQDKLFGGGSDTTIGDGSEDTFAFGNEDSGRNRGDADQVYNFVSGQDSINLGPTGGNKSITHIDQHDGNSYITLESHDGFNKMVIEVVGNDHVHKTDISFGLIALP